MGNGGMVEKPVRLVVGTEAKPDNIEALSDDDLMLLVSRQPTAAFSELLRRHQPIILGFSSRFVRNACLAREITQEVFLTVWAERDRYQPRGRFRSYLLSIAVNRCREALRKQKSIQTKAENFSQLQSVLDNDQQLPVDRIIDQEQTQRVLGALDRLKEPMRLAILLRYGHELSYDEIAQVMKKPQGTVKALVSRGIQKLHALLYSEQGP